MLSPHYGDFASPSLTFTPSTPSPVPTPTALQVHTPILESTMAMVPTDQLPTNEPNQKVRLLDILTRRNSNSSTQLIRIEPLSRFSSTSLPSTHVTSASAAQASTPPPHLPTTRQNSDLNTRRPSLSDFLASSFERRKSQAGIDSTEQELDQAGGASLLANRRLKGVPTLEEIGGRIRIRNEKLGENLVHIEDSTAFTRKDANQSGTGTEEEKILPLPMPTQLSIQKASDRPEPPSKSITSTVTPAQSLHPLSHTYSFYFRPLTTLTKATPRKFTGNKNNDLNKFLEEYTKIKAGVKDLETFCPYFNRAKRPSQLTMSGLIMGVGEGGESVAIVRESEISKVQLKRANIGYWNLSFPSSSHNSLPAPTSTSADKKEVSTAFALDRYWTWLVLGMVGGEVDSNHDGRNEGCKVLGAFATVLKDGTRSMQLWISIPSSDASQSSRLSKSSPLSASCTPLIPTGEGVIKKGETASTAQSPDASKNTYTPQQIEEINKLGYKLLVLLELEAEETKVDPLQLDNAKEGKEKENFRFCFHHSASTAGSGSAKLPSPFFSLDRFSPGPLSRGTGSGRGRW